MNNILRLIGRRLIALPVMVLGVTFLVFFLMSFSNIDPAYQALGEGASPEALEAYREAQGLNDPWLVQFGAFLAGMIQGDLGTYGSNQASVATRVAEAFPVTLELTFIGLFLSIIIALPLGVLAALFRDGWPDQAIRIISIVFLATPSFWLAVLLILLFSANLGMFPASGELPGFFEDPGGYIDRMMLPAFALAVPVAGSLIRIVRTSMVEELDKDYVRTALGAGIPKPVVIARNVLRNALITPVTVVGLRIGYLMGGAVVIEVIFNMPGMGMTILQGVQQNYPTLVQGVVLVVALAFIVINIIVDLLYLLINPRIRAV
ncbi:ABC transporter permease [Nesterenkonia aerolata]|uniref:ABC transporter permease n=1 Tax=Nesterenkonia aerolata TaxID=3074079 RepID=A0ABU2DTS4_9MICC|nr:ABC transporter permease [Nesterenkonia sp. LY-0111]MDR8019909.1 ABC transporter permease [Nesterenkonia sp. LY-0111]